MSSLNKIFTLFCPSQKCRATLKDCSYDKTNGVYLTDSNIVVLNFDEIKREYTQRLHVSEGGLCSVDALFQIRNTLFFIEFKNRPFSKSLSKEVKKKISDSVLLYLDMTDGRLTTFRENSEFILVYSDNSGLAEIRNSILAKADEELIEGDFSLLENLIFRKVHTYNETSFRNFIKKNGSMIKIS